MPSTTRRPKKEKETPTAATGAKAVAYIRVSTEEQARGGVSLAAQEERLRAYCQVAGLRMAALIREEGVSASIPLAERPGGEELLSILRDGRAGAVVALKLDRLFRDAADCLSQTRLWDEAGVSLHLVDMGGQTVNTASAMGRLFLTMTAAFAELERNLVAERTSAAMQHKKRKREAYSQTPFGFTRRGDRLVVDPAEQKIVRRAQGLRAKGWSLRQIAADFNAKHTGKQGGKWYASTVRQMLGNDLYAKPATRK